jgi:hypothetical protein
LVNKYSDDKYFLINYIFLLLKEIDFKKLEVLSLLSIDNVIKKDIKEVVKIVERMKFFETNNIKSLVYYDCLGY